jgi:hypothetical protein
MLLCPPRWVVKRRDARRFFGRRVPFVTIERVESL